MSEDALKSLLNAETGSPPAQDHAFAVKVMEGVARRRLIDGVAALFAAVAVLSVLLWLVMPYVTPALIAAGQPLLPAVGIVTAVAILFFAWEQLRPALRSFGLRI